MRARGIAYDTGLVRGGEISRRHFDPGVVRRELAIIRDDLRCNAVQLVGGDPNRLGTAARHAADLDLEVWLAPYPLDLTGEEILELFGDCARRAERLRQAGATVVFVAGTELSIMNPGFLPGSTLGERLASLLGGDPASRPARIAETSARLDAFLGRAVTAVRARFHGPVTYAAIPFEQIDWSRFDIVTMELIRSAAVAGQFRGGVRSLVAQGRPVAATGFGTAAWRGAGDVAPRSMDIVEHDPATGAPVRLDGDYTRDEEGQARYLAELLEIFDTEGIDAAFVYLFALESHPHRPDGHPRDDLDLASPGIVKVLEHGHGNAYPGLAWEPKLAFAAVADRYGRR